MFLVFDHGQTHVGVGDGKNAFGADGVLVKRNRNGAQRLRRQHGGVQARPVGTDDHHVRATRQAGLVQAAGNVLHQGGHAGPAVRLPNAVFLFAHGWRVRALGSVFHEQSGKRCLHAGLFEGD